MSEPLVHVTGVSFAYAAEPVLEDVDLVVGTGEFVALVGPNGSGKSTLLRILVGLLDPATGTARLFGDDPTRLRARSRLGYVPQRPALGQGVSATVDDIVSSGRLTKRSWLARPTATDRRAIDEALDAVALTELRRERVSELSGGQQQRAFIARALAGGPDLLVLDEPVAGVDVQSQLSFRASLEHLVDGGGSVLLVSHELGAVAPELDRVVVLKRSIRFDGPPEELAGQGVSLGVHAHDLPLWLEGITG
ncbi:MAG: metal ABC transporter ATP-binding protein [Acidimicrobiales bacterium]